MATIVYDGRYPKAPEAGRTIGVDAPLPHAARIIRTDAATAMAATV